MNFSDNEKIAGKKNYTGIVFVVVLHIIAGYGIVSGLGKKMISKMIEPVETKIIEEVSPPAPFDARKNSVTTWFASPLS